MARKSHKRLKFKLNAIDDFENFYDVFDGDFISDKYSRDTYSAEWGDDYERKSRNDIRRRVGRRRDMKKPYSQLDGWEEFADRMY